MERFNNLLLSLIFILIVGCATTAPNIQEPVDDRCLIIGAIILDIDGYRDLNTSLFEHIDVAIVGETVAEQGIKRVAFWAETDENGYFYVENVPPGRYALKGIKARSIDIGELTLVNELTDAARNYFQISPANDIPMTGDLFDLKDNHRIVNFQYNVFTLHRNGIVDFRRMKLIRNFKLSAGDVIDLPPVPSHFLDEFPACGWSAFLELQLN